MVDFSKERTLTVKEAAWLLGKTEDAVRMWLRRGRLKAWQVGGSYCEIRVSEASVMEALSRAALLPRYTRR